MKKLFMYALLALVAVALVGAVYYFYGPEAKNRTVEVTTDELVARPDLNFSFRFPSGEDALAFTQSAPGQFDNQELLQAFIMMKHADQQEYLAAGGGTTPPSIGVFVFDRGEVPVGTNPDGSELKAADRLRLWAEAHDGFTAISGAGDTVVEAEIDRVPALRYLTPGQYQQEIYVARHTDKIYVFVGQYENDNDYLRSAFAQLISSVLFD